MTKKCQEHRYLGSREIFVTTNTISSSSPVIKVNLKRPTSSFSDLAALKGAGVDTNTRFSAKLSGVKDNNEPLIHPSMG